MACPTFRDLGGDRFISPVHYESPKSISAASRAPESLRQDEEEDESDDEDEGDFEFAFALTDPGHGDETTAAAAADIFSDGRIRPLCPVFGRGLPLGDGPVDRDQIQRLLGNKPQRDSGLDSTPILSEVDDLERVVPGTYCSWAPRPSEAAAQGRRKKSSSTGSLQQWRIRDLMARRSQSDGKKTGMFLASKERRGHKKKAEKGTPPRSHRTESEVAVKEGNEEKNGRGGNGGGVKAGQWDIVTALRMYYGKGGEQAARHGARRSFLPYKRNVVGFFANVNGIGRRCHHPC
ncbi:hypothetical protein OPV22_019093 [Ensete ventricosum]|uniref:Uncharacterized protein n=1 Tax=Ensete ventricosum TaxID=4639 RepID=A0AAV8R035_ENSVE|nr:hypothetical protein OPV22_019093 [Ensete ventricosum]RWW03505.1 hypothetical protein GW17_00033331 [Ensete ventricosum]RWW36393.1 hypothetical protein BHE74_00058594 [Ensete ventricosum]RZS24703.1 hypothetical protein BHM03_00057799 [Ensete ventricosum]